MAEPASPVVEAARADPRATSRPALSLVLRRLSAAVLIVAADLWSKAAAFAWLDRLRSGGGLAWDPHGHPRRLLLGEWLTFMQSRNPGAAFGQLESFPWLLVVGRCVAAVFLVWLIARTPRGRPWFTAALVLVLGGAIGNLYDNLFLDVAGDRHPFGLVRDFVDVYFTGLDWHFPTFNVADSCITTGAVLLLLTSFGRAEKSEAVPRPAEPG